MRRVFMMLVVMLLFAAPALSSDKHDGKKLYARYCEECHGPVAKSDVGGATLDDVKYAMTDRMCGQAGGNKLSEAELAAISRALGAKSR